MCESVMRQPKLRVLPDFECAACGHRTKTMVGIKSHIQRKHKGILYDCDVCIKRFSQASSLKTHKKLHQDKTKFTYERHLLEGKKLLDFMVDNCVPVAVMPKEDMDLINLYRRYVYQESGTFEDENVPL